MTAIDTMIDAVRNYRPPQPGRRREGEALRFAVNHALVSGEQTIPVDECPVVVFGTHRIKRQENYRKRITVVTRAWVEIGDTIYDSRNPRCYTSGDLAWSRRDYYKKFGAKAVTRLNVQNAPPRSRQRIS